MKKLKIAHILHSPSVEKEGGIAQFLHNLLFFIDKTHTEIYVICHCCDDSTYIKLGNMGITVYTLFEQQNSSLINPLQTLKSLQKIIKEIKVDIVNTHNHWGDLYGRKAAYNSNIPVIISTEHNIILNETNEYKTSKHRLTKITNTVICVSNAVKKYALTMDKIPKSKLRVIYNGIPLQEYPCKFNFSTLKTDSYQRSSEYQNIGDFVFIARLEPQKMPLRIIDAIASLQKKGYDCCLSIIGDGSLKSECEQQVKKLRLTNKIKFFGYQKKPWQLIDRDHIFVMTSDFEGNPQAVLESMASGHLSIFPNLEALLEIATDGQEAIFYEAGNQEDLVIKMELALNLSLSEKLSILKQARIKVEEKFDAKIMAQNYLSLYQELYQIV